MRIKTIYKVVLPLIIIGLISASGCANKYKENVDFQEKITEMEIKIANQDEVIANLLGYAVMTDLTKDIINITVNDTGKKPVIIEFYGENLNVDKAALANPEVTYRIAKEYSDGKRLTTVILPNESWNKGDKIELNISQLGVTGLMEFATVIIGEM